MNEPRVSPAPLARVKQEVGDTAEELGEDSERVGFRFFNEYHSDATSVSP
jgi:hypothetical protein